MGNKKGASLAVLSTCGWHDKRIPLTWSASTMLVLCILSAISSCSEAVPRPVMKPCGMTACNDLTQWCDTGLNICGSCAELCDPGRVKGDKASEEDCRQKCRVYMLVRVAGTTPTTGTTSSSQDTLLHQIAQKVATGEKVIWAIFILMGVLVLVVVVAIIVGYKRCKAYHNKPKLCTTDAFPLVKVSNNLAAERSQRQTVYTGLACPETAPLVQQHQPLDVTPGTGSGVAVTTAPGYTARQTGGSDPLIHQAELESKGNEESREMSNSSSSSVHSQDTEYDCNKLHPTDGMMQDLQDQTNLNQTYTKLSLGD